MVQRLSSVHLTPVLPMNYWPVFLLSVIIDSLLNSEFSVFRVLVLHRSHVCILLLWGLQINPSWEQFDMIIYAWSLSTWTWHIIYFVAACERFWPWIWPFCLTWFWHILQASLQGSLARRQAPPGRSGPKLGQIWVGGDFGSSSGQRGMFELVARQIGRFWFASFKHLVAISDVRRKRNKYEAFLQRASISFPWVHSFLDFFFKQKGEKSAACFSLVRWSFAGQGSPCGLQQSVTRRLYWGLHQNCDTA